MSPPIDQAKAHVTHVGTATMVLELNDRVVVTDPVLDPAGSSYMLGSPALGGMGYTNLVGPAADVPASPDLVLLSHDHHRDNLDAAGLAYARTARTVVTTSSGAARLRRKGLERAIGLSPWESVTLGNLRVTATPARHGPIGTNWLAGDVVGFVVESPTLDRGAMYITGDTRWFSGTAEVARRVPHVGTVFAHVGAARFGRGALREWLRFSMNAQEARVMAGAFPSACFIPIHYEGWSHFTEGRRDLEDAFAEAGLRQALRFLSLGERSAIEASGREY